MYSSVKMILSVIFFLLCSLPRIDSQHNYRPIPPNFDLTIRQWRQHSNGDSPQLQHFEHLLNMPAKLREWLETALFTSAKAVDCEHDLETLFQAVAQNHLWALKILDSWGKPLPSALLKGNVLWTGNYDECLEPLYQPSNKSFVKQPLTTQYCE